MAVSRPVSLALLICTPLLIMAGTRAYVDIPLAAYSTVVVLCLLRYHSSASPGWLAISGLALGWSIGSKYVAIMLVPAIGSTVWARARSRRGSQALLMAGILMCFTAGPWYLKNVLLTGHPLFPLTIWHSSDSTGTGRAILETPIVPGLSPWSSMPRIEALLTNAGGVDGPLLCLFAGLLPIAFVSNQLSSVPIRFIATYLLCWILAWPDVRYLGPVLPLISVVTARSLAWCMAVPLLVRPVSTVVKMSLIATTLFTISNAWVTIDFEQVPFGLKSFRERERASMEPIPNGSYAADYVNAHCPRGGRLLMASGLFSFPYDRECLTDNQDNVSQVARLITSVSDGEELAKRFRQHGIAAIVSDENGVRAVSGNRSAFPIGDSGWAVWKRFLQDHAVTEFQTDGVAVFRIVKRHPPKRLTDIPIYSTLMFDRADAGMNGRSARTAIMSYLSPPSLLEDVGSTFARQGKAFLALGELEDARNALRRAQSAGVDTPGLHLALAALLDRQGRRAAAIAEAATALRQDPESGRPAAFLADLRAR
jgi:hypothetical protein